jgi:hypothetical protein
MFLLFVYLTRIWQYRMVLIYSKENSPRLEYTVGLIFHDILGTEVTITQDPVLFRNSGDPKINYSNFAMEGGLFLKSGYFLFTSQIQLPEIQPIRFGEETGFFETSPDSFLPFDPLASTFLMVSRMEEYLPGPRDQHGRFPAASSIQYKYGLLEKPVVNRWARLIASALEKKYGPSLFPTKTFTFLSTIDVDNAWSYQYKGIFRSVAATLRDLLQGNFREIRSRFCVLTGKEKDPYDTYQYLKDIFKGNEDKVIFFFLLGDYARNDKQVSWKNKHFRKLISDIGLLFKAGIHPSFASSEAGHAAQIMTEKDRLERILSKKINKSRQHYLLLRFPETYREILHAGVTEDYSMGFPDLPGFRAGICTPFFFYDLTTEQTTPLKIYPFQTMEMTFSQYLGYNPEETMNKIKTLMEEVKSAGGTFCPIWHNESLSGEEKWKGFREVFEEMNETGFRYANRI